MDKQKLYDEAFSLLKEIDLLLDKNFERIMKSGKLIK
jgi:hypothetical protein